MQAQRSDRYLPYFLKQSKFWMASSRVGVRTRARIFAGSCSPRTWRIGSANAAVLPVPVWAQAIRSLPESAAGMAFSWIGVGVVYSAFFRASRMGCFSCMSSKFVINLFGFFLFRIYTKKTRHMPDH